MEFQKMLEMLQKIVSCDTHNSQLEMLTKGFLDEFRNSETNTDTVKFVEDVLQNLFKSQKVEPELKEVEPAPKKDDELLKTVMVDLFGCTKDQYGRVSGALRMRENPNAKCDTFELKFFIHVMCPEIPMEKCSKITNTMNMVME